MEAAESGPIKTLGRVGLVAYGIVHLLVAYLVVRVALGGGAKADKTGALQTIAEQPAGRFFLWVLTVGLVALAIWQLAEAGWGHRYRRPRRRRTLQRLVSLGEAAVAGRWRSVPSRSPRARRATPSRRRRPSSTRSSTGRPASCWSPWPAWGSWPSPSTWFTGAWPRRS
jgi:hypothetical protein